MRHANKVNRRGVKRSQGYDLGNASARECRTAFIGAYRGSGGDFLRRSAQILWVREKKREQGGRKKKRGKAP